MNDMPINSNDFPLYYLEKCFIILSDNILAKKGDKKWVLSDILAKSLNAFAVMLL